MIWLAFTTEVQPRHSIKGIGIIFGYSSFAYYNRFTDSNSDIIKIFHDFIHEYSPKQGQIAPKNKTSM